MPKPTIVERVEIVEQTVEQLGTLPAQVEALGVQIVQLRGEMRDEFSAVRGELREGLASVRGELAEGLAAVRAEIKAGDDETRRQMRVLFEEVLARIATIGEGFRRQSPRRRGGS